MIHLDYRDARPIYIQIVENLRMQIRKGIRLPGDKLPSVRELAAQLTINPNTIQRAYRELESTGWIVSVSGKGCFVGDTPTAAQHAQESLLEEFDRVTAALLATGITEEALIRRLQQGGNHIA